MSKTRVARSRGRRPNFPAPVDSTSPERWCGFLLHRLSVISRKIYEKHLRPVDLRPAQIGILQVLRSSGKIIQGVAAETLGVNAPTMTVLANALAHRGLIVKQAHSEDGRTNVLRISDSGESIMRQLESLNAEADRELMNPLTAAEQDTLRALLYKIYQAHVQNPSDQSAIRT